MSGWITLHRKFLDWEWYADANTSRLFIHLLLTANHRDKKWRGIEIKRGQVLTGRSALAAATGLSVKSVRTGLERLQSTNEVAIKTTNKYSIITITNWEKYQDRGQQEGQQEANKGPSKGQQGATTNNVNNVNNENNDYSPPDGGYAFEGKIIRLNHPDFDRWKKAYPNIPDLRAELTSLDDYFHTDKPKNWFAAVSGALRKRNNTYRDNQPAAKRPMQLISQQDTVIGGDDWRSEEEKQHG